MGDRLGIQVAVDILPFFATFIHIRFDKLITIFVKVYFVMFCMKSSKFARPRLTRPGLEQSNLRTGSRRKASITYNKMHNCAPYNFNFLPAIEHFGFITPRFFPSPLVYGHITLNTPVLVRSLKLSKVETC